MDNIYVDRLLLVAFVKYILSQIYSHFFRTVLFETFWRRGNLYFLREIFSKSCYIYVFFCPETNNFNNSEVVGRRKLPDSSMDHNFNVLSIGLQYTLSFKRPNFGLKCLVTITPKAQSLKFKANVWMK